MPCNPIGPGFRPGGLPFPFSIPTQVILLITQDDQHIAVFFLNGCATPAVVDDAAAQQLICDGCPTITLPVVA